MCEVSTAISALGMGLQGAGVISNYLADKQTSEAYSTYHALQTQSTLQNYMAQTRAINTRYAQEQEAAGLDAQQIYIQNLQAKATAQASAASSGVEGISLDNLYRGYDRATAISDYVSARNLHWKGLQYSEELESLRTQAISSINMQQMTEPSKGASILISGLGTMLSNYSAHGERKERLKFYRGN